MTAFEALVEPHRAHLRLHCYRMLGSSHDSDDMVQETSVRAFRARHTLQDPALARAWLYRIATNVCIDELAKRPRRARGPERGPPADPDLPPAAATADVEWLYRAGADGQWSLFALQVLEPGAGRIRVIDHFMSASSHAAFFASGLARTLPVPPG